MAVAVKDVCSKMSSHDIAIEQYDRIDDLIADKYRERQIKIQTMVCQTDLPDRLPARLAVYTFWSLLRLLLMLLGAVAIVVAVAFAFAVAVAVAFAYTFYGLIRRKISQKIIFKQGIAWRS